MSIEDQDQLLALLEGMGDAMHEWCKDKQIGFEIGPTVDDFIKITVFSDFYDDNRMEQLVDDLPRIVHEHGESVFIAVRKSKICQLLSNPASGVTVTDPNSLATSSTELSHHTK